MKRHRAIEADPSKLLVLAHPDHPIRRELDRLKDSRAPLKAWRRIEGDAHPQLADPIPFLGCHDCHD